MKMLLQVQKFADIRLMLKFAYQKLTNLQTTTEVRTRRHLLNSLQLAQALHHQFY